MIRVVYCGADRTSTLTHEKNVSQAVDPEPIARKKSDPYELVGAWPWIESRSTAM